MITTLRIAAELDAANPRYEGGAFMDGSHDDGPAFRAALRHAAEIGGAVIKASRKGVRGRGTGVAKISGQLPIPSLTSLDLRNTRLVRANVAGEGLITNVPGAIRPQVLGGDIDGRKQAFSSNHNRGIFWQYCNSPKVVGTVVRNTYAEAFRADAATADFLFEDTEAIDIGTPYPQNPDGNGYFLRSLSTGLSITEKLRGSPTAVAAKLFGLKDPRPIWPGASALPTSHHETWTLTKLSTGRWSVVGTVSGRSAEAAENVAYANGKIAFKIVPQPGAAYVSGDTILLEVGPDGTGTNLGKSPNTTYGQLVRPKARRCALSSLVSYNAGNGSSVIDTPAFSDALGARHINIGAYSHGWKIIAPDCRNAHSSILNLTRVRDVRVTGGILAGTAVDASGVGLYGQCISVGPAAEDVVVDGTECCVAATDGVIVLPGSRNIRLRVYAHHNAQNLLARDGVTPVRTGIHAGADGIRLRAGDGGGYLPEGDVSSVDLGGSRCEWTQQGSGVRAYSDNAGRNKVLELKIATARLDDNSRYGYDFDRHTTVSVLGNLRPLRNRLGERPPKS